MRLLQGGKDQARALPETGNTREFTSHSKPGL